MRKQIILLFTLLPLFFCLQCKKCKDGEKRENLDIPIDQKNAIFRFSEGTQWVFKSNGGDMDTFYLGPLLYSYLNEGTCKDIRDCCTKQYPQIIRQNINFVLDADGLDKINYHYDNLTHWLKPKIGAAYEFSNFQSFNDFYKSTLNVNGTTLNDVESVIHLGPNLGDIGIDAVYWSLSKGLVRYDYQNADGSFIIYERQDL